jgi:predicted nucleic acid-binding protein
MNSSSSTTLERGLDTMILVYSSLDGHPAQIPCQQLIIGRSGWFTSCLVLIEVKNILTKVYGVSAVDATAKIAQIMATPIVVVGIDKVNFAGALPFADQTGLDFTDAVLLKLVQQVGAGKLATDDQKLIKACSACNVAAVSPLDFMLRQQIAAWEAANLAPKGIARIMHRVHQWLAQSHTAAAQDFWSQTGRGSHLP